ncbi:hypothetical protein SAMN06295912_11477 [Sphingomonas laterariae]|uniref:Uncharacterized protein n=1 Tax=Edaphosphingomonas laterariae TaxID=861865 RepID=A0A239H2C5_9SPHN|nr:hypothetical protein [Sphingomonas laterariae]SNS74953.1 hypothetical protein SAMN06295912_11477 [Sphingomonas laterariae]
MRKRSGANMPWRDREARADAGVATRLRAPRKDLLVDDSADALMVGARGEAAPVAYSYSRVEEHWDILVRPDGSAKASVVVRREQQVSSDHRWRFVARRELPLAAERRSRLGLAAACMAMVTASAALWMAWARPAPQAAKVITVSVPAPPLVTPSMTGGEPTGTPPAANQAMAKPVPRAPTPVPLIFPLERKLPLRAESPGPQPSAVAANIPVEARPAVRSAMSRAFASGEAEAWSDDALTGFVVVGPVEAGADGTCRNTVILARGGENGDRTISKRRCQAASGAISAG